MKKQRVHGNKQAATKLL